jgi:AcrR family transcriptional regulator
MTNEELKKQGIDHALQSAFQLYLAHGIEQVTKEMIAKDCKLSLRTVNRYFPSKTDCVIMTAEWVLLEIRRDAMSRYPESMFTGKRYTGLQLLEMYMNDMKALFFRDSRIWVLYAEFKMYIYRHCETYEQRYTQLCECMGNHRLRQKIYKLGIKDGSMPKDLDLALEEEYFTEAYFGFLSNLAFSYSLKNKGEIEHQIDQRIENTIRFYREHNKNPDPAMIP